MAYDLCRAVDGAPSDAALFPAARAASAGAFEFWTPPVRIVVGQAIGRGKAAAIYRGTFGGAAAAIKVNDPRRVPLRADAAEVRLQARLYCHLRDRGRLGAGGAARVPEPLFAARLPGVGRALGMERVECCLLARVHGLRAPRAQVAQLRAALGAVARLLAVLQADFRFMHGDLHGANVMLGARDAVYLVDFGMASVARRGGGRDVADERYAGVAFHPHLDLLTLVTSLREDLALGGDEAAARWCDGFVRPFWDAVRAGLAGAARPAFGARHTVRSARRALAEHGEVYYAHHLLYEDAGGVRYPPCSPRGLLRALDEAGGPPAPSAGWRVRIFEDVEDV